MMMTKKMWHITAEFVRIRSFKTTLYSLQNCQNNFKFTKIKSNKHQILNQGFLFLDD